MEVLALVAAVVVVALGYSKYKHRYWSSRGVPTVPNAMPFIGHLALAMKKNSWLYFNKVKLVVILVV